jgi:hypothetical protein
MHALTGEDPQQAESLLHGRGSQYATAIQALLRFKEVGGPLQQLVAAGEFGQV